MVTQKMLDDAVRESYEYAHMYCHYAPTDNSFPVGADEKMDCTGLMLRALYNLGLIHEAYNCDQIDSLMGSLGFIKTEDFEDVYSSHCFVQWVQPQWVGSEHVHHTYYSLGGHDGCIDKYDLGSEWRLRAEQPFYNVSPDEWDGLVFKHAWKLDEKRGIYLKVGGC